jgi:hypothetical protein
MFSVGPHYVEPATAFREGVSATGAGAWLGGNIARNKQKPWQGGAGATLGGRMAGFSSLGAELGQGVFVLTPPSSSKGMVPMRSNLRGGADR